MYGSGKDEVGEEELGAVVDGGETEGDQDVGECVPVPDVVLFVVGAGGCGPGCEGDAGEADEDGEEAEGEVWEGEGHCGGGEGWRSGW